MSLSFPWLFYPCRSWLREIRVVYGSIPPDGEEIAIMSRSMFEILVGMAFEMDVPEIHVKEKRVYPTMVNPEEEKAGIRHLVQIKSSAAPPNDACVAVPYRDSWFWIDDRDYPSKRLFSILMFLFTLAESGGPVRGPVVTIPTG